MAHGRLLVHVNASLWIVQMIDVHISLL